MAMIVLFKPSLTTFIIYSLSINIGGAFFGHPLTGLQIHASKKYSDSQEEMLGNLLSRVCMLTSGRVFFFYFIAHVLYRFYIPLFFMFSWDTIFFIPLHSFWLVRNEI